MKKEPLIQKSIEMVSEYYKGNFAPFFDNISQRVLWIGPRGGQELKGKEDIIETWMAAETDLHFTMGGIQAKSVAIGVASLEVLLEYYVYTSFPTGETDQHHQRIHYSWGYEGRDEAGGRIPKVFMIHLSNITEEAPASSDAPVQVYASSPEHSNRDAVSPIILRGMSGIYFKTVARKGEPDITYYFNSAVILWIESTNHSLHAIVHTLEGPYKSAYNLRHFEACFPDVFIRAHASHLVNPLYVRAVRRFKVTLSDGTELPIPQKKYTAFKRRLEAWYQNNANH